MSFSVVVSWLKRLQRQTGSDSDSAPPSISNGVLARIPFGLSRSPLTCAFASSECAPSGERERGVHFRRAFRLWFTLNTRKPPPRWTRTAPARFGPLFHVNLERLGRALHGPPGKPLALRLLPEVGRAPRSVGERVNEERLGPVLLRRGPFGRPAEKLLGHTIARASPYHFRHVVQLIADDRVGKALCLGRQVRLRDSQDAASQVALVIRVRCDQQTGAGSPDDPDGAAAAVQRASAQVHGLVEVTKHQHGGARLLGHQLQLVHDPPHVLISVAVHVTSEERHLRPTAVPRWSGRTDPRSQAAASRW